LPQEQVNRRRKKLHEEFRRKWGRSPSAGRLAWCDWTILVTSVPVEMLSVSEAAVLYRARWQVEHYHRGLKQCTGVERCQSRSATAQRNHIGLAVRAFLRLEAHCFARGVSWVEAKTGIIREAVRAYLARPRFRLPMPATA
jgi:hypothetical protein